MHHRTQDMKYIKLHPAAPYHTIRLSRETQHKGQSIQIKLLLKKLLIILCLAVVSGITIMAYFLDGVLFGKLLAGLFIVGCLLFLKRIGNEKNDIQRTQRNIYK